MKDPMDLNEPVCESASAARFDSTSSDEATEEMEALLTDLPDRAKDDKGAPFESAVLKALSVLRDHDPAQFQRIRDGLKKAGVSLRELDREVQKQNFRVIEGGTGRGDGDPTVKGLMLAALLEGPRPVSELIALFGVSRGSISRSTKLLRKRGYDIKCRGVKAGPGGTPGTYHLVIDPKRQPWLHLGAMDWCGALDDRK